MNALTRTVTVTKTYWVDGMLELWLSDGAFVRVGWDLDYHHRLLLVAPDEHGDWRDATGEEIPLHPDELDSYVSEAKRRTQDEADEAAAEHDSAPRVSFADRCYGSGR